MKPTGNKLLVKRAKQETKQGSIIMLDSSQEKSKECEVVATGPGNYNINGILIPMQVKVGDRLMLSTNVGYPVKSDEKEFELFIIREEEVLAIL